MVGNKLLEIPPNAIQEIRKIYNLDAPGRIGEAIEILEKWIKQENHIVKKDFGKEYLEWTIISSKGSLEKAKKKIDRLCTLKTLLPQFFEKHNVKVELKNILDIVSMVVLPKMTKDFYRIQIIKFNDKNIAEKTFLEFFQYNIIMCEYIKIHDYANGVIIIYDLQEANIMNLVINLNPTMLQQQMSITIEGFGVRLKAIHLITQSTAIDVAIKTVKPFLSQKISDRIFVHKTIQDLHKVIPKDLLPEDYGGKENAIEKLAQDLVEEISSEDNVEYFKMISKACTDETLRRSDKFNEEYMGMPGSFRNLKVD